MFIPIVNLSKKYQEHCLLKNYVLCYILKKHLFLYFCIMTSLQWYFTYIYLLTYTNVFIFYLPVPILTVISLPQITIAAS